MSWWKNTKLFKPTAEDSVGDKYKGLPPGYIPEWQAGFEFNFGREVLGPDGKYYRCIVSHDSSDKFENDLADLYWVAFK